MEILFLKIGAICMGIKTNSIAFHLAEKSKVTRVLCTYTVFPHIVFSLEYFPPLNSFPTLVRKLFKFSLHRRKTNAETI